MKRILENFTYKPKNIWAIKITSFFWVASRARASDYSSPLSLQPPLSRTLGSAANFSSSSGPNWRPIHHRLLPLSFLCFNECKYDELRMQTEGEERVYGVAKLCLKRVRLVFGGDEEVRTRLFASPIPLLVFCWFYSKISK